MSITRCPNGHFYNDAKYSECPHCASGKDISQSSRKLEIEAERAGENIRFAAAPRSAEISEKKAPAHSNLKIQQQKIYSPEPDDQITVSASYEPAVGWLVCTAGTLCGKDFTLHRGHNIIAELTGIDSIDPRISVVYDNMNNIFLLFSADIPVGLNGQKSSGAAKLRPRSRIQLSGLEFLFVPLCTEDFKW